MGLGRLTPGAPRTISADIGFLRVALPQLPATPLATSIAPHGRFVGHTSRNAGTGMIPSCLSGLALFCYQSRAEGMLILLPGLDYNTVLAPLDSCRQCAGNTTGLLHDIRADTHCAAYRRQQSPPWVSNPFSRTHLWLATYMLFTILHAKYCATSR